MKPGSKIFTGVLIVVAVLPIQILLVFGLLYSLFSGGIGHQSLSQEIFNFIFMIMLFSFPLHYGLKIRRKGISERAKVDIVPDVDAEVKFSAQIDLKDYRKLIIGQTIRHPGVVYLMFLGITFLIYSILNEASGWGGLVIGMVFLLIPFVGFLGLRRTFLSNKNLREKIDYEINVDNIIVKGETFNSTQAWKNLYKVKETKDWFLLYTSRKSMLILSKEHMSSSNVNNEETLRTIINGQAELLTEMQKIEQ